MAVWSVLRAVAPTFQRVHEQGVKRRNTAVALLTRTQALTARKKQKECTLCFVYGGARDARDAREARAESFIVWGSLFSATTATTATKVHAIIQELASKYMLTYCMCSR